MKIYAESHIGCVRTENQDVYAVQAVSEGMLAVVCDGMGGTAGGRIAAELASDVFCRKFSSVYDDLVRDAAADDFVLHRVYADAVYAANQQVFERSVTMPELHGMGTTLSAVYVDGQSLYAINIGDSRIYLYHQGVLTRISHDDSLVQQKIDTGIITEDEAFQSKERHFLTRALGTDSYTDFDFYTTSVSPQDRILLCSDGLTTQYKDKEIASFFAADDISCMVKRMIEGANEKGGHDNITIVCLAVES